MKTANLIGPALDWAVAIALGHNKQDVITDFGVYIRIKTQPAGMLTFCPSTDWSQGGPIIEREGIELSPFTDSTSNGPIRLWVATRYERFAMFEEQGPTPLIAAMRCFVTSRLGDEVDIPEELA